MKKIITSVALMSVFAGANAQTYATNFTAPDCNSVAHTLFTEMDNGKIIVMVWVMPCSNCVNGAKAASNAVQSFTSNPGTVVGYLSDDMGDDNCSAISTWMSTNGVGTNLTTMDNTGNVIKESNFGGSGMPHVVVMGGTDHKIYFNKMNGAANDLAGITAAINSAIVAAGVKNVAGAAQFSVSPNPVTNKLTVTYAKAISKITIMSVAGQVVKEEVYSNGKANPTINVSGIADGVYTIKITDVERKSGINKLVKE